MPVEELEIGTRDGEDKEFLDRVFHGGHRHLGEARRLRVRGSAGR